MRWLHRATKPDVVLYIIGSGTFQLIGAAEYVLTHRDPSMVHILIVADKFWPVPPLISSLWDEVHLVSVYGHRATSEVVVRRRWTNRVRHYRLLRGIARAVRGRNILGLVSSDNAVTWVLAHLNPVSDVTLIDEGYSAISASRDRQSKLERQPVRNICLRLRDAAKVRLKEAVRLDSPPRSAVNYFSAFEPNVGIHDRLERTEFLAVVDLADSKPAESGLAWIIGSAGALDAYMGVGRYKRLVVKTSTELRRMGADRIGYLASPHEPVGQHSYLNDLGSGSGLDGPAIDYLVPSDLSVPIELRLLTVTRPGTAIAVMPYTSSLVSLACLYKDAGAILVSVVAVADEGLEIASLGARLHEIASKVKSGIRVVHE